MSDRPLLLEFADNPVVFAIIGLALLCYLVQFNLILGERDAEWKRQTGVWLKVLPVLLGALPLLGLLGTIAGLLTTFRSMAGPIGFDEQTLLSGGIADALITTQLGLVMVVPGWILQTLVVRRHRELV